MVMRLTIDPQQEEALRQRAKHLGISEEELVRKAIDSALAEPTPAPLPDHTRALQEFLEEARQIAESRVGEEPYKFNREELYEERESRWTGRG